MTNCVAPPAIGLAAANVSLEGWNQILLESSTTTTGTSRRVALSGFVASRADRSHTRETGPSMETASLRQAQSVPITKGKRKGKYHRPFGERSGAAKRCARSMHGWVRLT
jgi:hypothetical protein